MACFGKPGTLALLCLLPVRPLGRLLRPPPASRGAFRSQAPVQEPGRAPQPRPNAAGPGPPPHRGRQLQQPRWEARKAH